MSTHPFYGSLDRGQIDFEDPYNELLLDSVLDLCIDAACELVAGQPEGWRARAVIDLLSSTATTGGEEWWLIAKLRDRASARDNALENKASSVTGSWRENPRNGVQVRRACADT